MRIAITGVAGFIGSNLAERLLKLGHTVIGIDNLSYGVRTQVPSEVIFFESDIRSSKLSPLFDRVDVIYHLAAKNCIADCQNDPIETADINVLGSIRVFEAAYKAGVRRLIYAESSAVYEGTAEFPTPEAECSPQSFYAVSKAADHMFAQCYARFRDLQITALRYFGVYGPRQDYRRTVPPLMSAFIIKMLRGERPIIYGDGSKKRDFVYIDDVNEFHALCLSDDRTISRTFNIAFGIPYSVNEIYERIAKLLHFDLPPLYEADLPGEAKITHGDISSAKALGWEPRITLDEGLKRSIEFIQSNVELDHASC